jgi:hypothetical protein
MKTSMTKSEEMAHFQAFVDDLPQDSYLNSLLRPLIGAVNENIRNDWACSDMLMDVWARTREAQDEEASVLAKVKEARQALAVAEVNLKTFKTIRAREVEKIREEARQLFEGLAREAKAAR